MKESEIDRAVEKARGYLNGSDALGYEDLMRVCQALVAIDDDRVEEDGDDEACFPVTQANVACLERVDFFDEEKTIQRRRPGLLTRAFRRLLGAAS